MNKDAHYSYIVFGTIQKKYPRQNLEPMSPHRPDVAALHDVVRVDGDGVDVVPRAVVVVAGAHAGEDAAGGKLGVLFVSEIFFLPLYRACLFKWQCNRSCSLCTSSFMPCIVTHSVSCSGLQKARMSPTEQLSPIFFAKSIHSSLEYILVF